MSAAAVEDARAVVEAVEQRDQVVEDETFEQLPQSFILIDELQQCGVSATDLKVRLPSRIARVSALPSRARCPSRALTRPSRGFPFPPELFPHTRSTPAVPSRPTRK